MAESSNMNDFFDQLPTPPREKVVRWAFYAGAGLIALGVGLKLMPPVNNLLDMVLHGAWTLAQIGFVSGVIAVGAVAFFSLWPAYQRYMESLARRTTIAIFGDDPITPLHMWLEEVNRDCDTIEHATQDIGGVIAENAKTYDDNMAELTKHDAQFRVAVKKFGEDSHQARMASMEAGGFKDRAENAQRINGPLIELHDMLAEIAETTRQGQHQAEIDIGTAEQEWRAALKADAAMGAANRVLNKRSQRYVNATMAFDIIRQKYAGNFGRLRSLRRLSEGAINAGVLNQGVKQEEAIQRLRAETQKLIGHAPAIPVPDFSGHGKDAVPAKTGTAKADLRLFDEDQK